MMKKIALILGSFFLFSCGGSTYQEPDYYFEGKFDPSLVSSLDMYMKRLAEDRNFRVFEKDRTQMKTLTQDKDALYISFYKNNKDKPILWVSNVGTGTVLTLGLLSNESFSLQEVKALAEAVTKYLKTEMNIKMKPVSPSSP